mgnify:CR=1 FL=1
MAVIDQTTSGEPPLHTVIYNNSNPNCTMAANAQESGNCIDEPRALVLHPQKVLPLLSLPPHLPTPTRPSLISLLYCYRA